MTLRASELKKITSDADPDLYGPGVWDRIRILALINDPTSISLVWGKSQKY
jgi:hypothetical protein